MTEKAKGRVQAALGVVLRTIGLGICEQKRTRRVAVRFLKGARPRLRTKERRDRSRLQQGFPPT